MKSHVFGPDNNFYCLHGLHHHQNWKKATTKQSWGEWDKNNKSQIKAFNVINVKQTNLQSLIQYLFEKEKEKQQQETNKASTVSMLNRIRFGTIFFFRPLSHSCNYTFRALLMFQSVCVCFFSSFTCDMLKSAQRTQSVNGLCISNPDTFIIQIYYKKAMIESRCGCLCYGKEKL